MARRKGICHLCGKGGALSFEHVPPASAFNDRPALWGTMEDWLAMERLLKSGERPRIGRRLAPEGMGRHTLCAGSDGCNTRTGTWYAPELVRWCEQGVLLLHHVPPSEREVRVTFTRVHPLRFIKQTATMMFSANSPEFHKYHAELVRFVLNRDTTGLPNKYDFRLTLFHGPLARSAPVTGHLAIDTGRVQIVTEVAYPPWAYTLHLNGPREGSLGQITHFARYGYDELADVTLTLAIGEGHTPFPTDFRTWEEVERDRLKNELDAQRLGLNS